MNHFLLVEFFYFPNNIDLSNSTERKGASSICILHCYNAGVYSCILYFIIGFNVEQDILLDCRLILFDFGI